MRIRIIENETVAAIGAVRATRSEETVVILDPNLSPGEKYRLLVELLEE